MCCLYSRIELLRKYQVGRRPSDGSQSSNSRRIRNAQAHDFTHHVVPSVSVFSTHFTRCWILLRNEIANITNLVAQAESLHWLIMRQSAFIMEKSENRFSPKGDSFPLSQPEAILPTPVHGNYHKHLPAGSEAGFGLAPQTILNELIAGR